MQNPYHLIPIATVAVIFYLLSFTLMKLGIVSKLFHRRFWNILLLITFFVTAILGLLLTIQINYKLEWSIIKTILKFHVDFGIGMSFIAVFHLTWHWNFYTSILRGNSKKSKAANNSRTIEYSGKSVNNYLILLSGFLSMVIQVLLMREITTVFQGNEILMVWTLGIWMLLNGAGVWVGSKIKIVPAKETITKIIIVFSLLPLLLIPLLNIFRNIIFPTGVLVHPFSFLLLVVILLLPICALTGLTFALLIRNVHKTKDGFIRVYALEALGCMAGGVISSFVLLNWLSITQSLLLSSLMLQISLYFLNRKKVFVLGSAFLFVLLISTYFFHTNQLIKSRLFVNQEIIETKETYYGNVTVTQKAGQYNFFENGNLLFTSQNTIISEEFVHFAMLQRNNPGQVLLVSGGVSGMLEELIKYPNLKSVEYVELNPELVRMAEKYFPVPEDDRIHVIFDDIRKYLRASDLTFDIAIIALPDPASLQINRIFTKEFIGILSKRMNPGGIVIYGLSSSGNYLSDSQLNTSALMYNTLHTSFQNVLIIPGERDYYLASDSVLNSAIGELWTRNPVDNLYVNAYYIDDLSIRERGDYIMNEISQIPLVNTDNKPLPVFYNVLNYLSQFDFPKEILWIALMILLLIPLSLMRSLTSGVYLAGFSGAAAEILLVFVFQIVYGYVYSVIGLIIALFMGGLVLGSILAKRIKIQIRHFYLAQSVMAIYFLIFPILIYFNPVGASFTALLLFLIMIVIPSVIIGFMYVAATKLSPAHIDHAAPAMYAADLLGAAVGVILISALLLPVLGIKGSCFIIAGMNGLVILLGLSGYKRISS